MNDDFLPLIERTLDEVLPAATERPAELSAAMRYAVGSGGKRIRPLICFGAARAVGGEPADARYAAAAIELLHNYTLVHDDLPAMDNDVERRGQPTVWKKFGAANAILAGDALQALAFASAAKTPRNAGAVVAELAAAGVGVVQGQVEDLKREGGGSGAAATSRSFADGSGTLCAAESSSLLNGPAPLPKELVDFVYRHKTADLFIAAAAMGAYAAGATAEQVAQLKDYACNLGLAFQYEDDLLDGDSPFSKEKTEALVRQTTDAARAALTGLPGDTSFLTALAERLVGRTV